MIELIFFIFKELATLNNLANMSRCRLLHFLSNAHTSFNGEWRHAAVDTSSFSQIIYKVLVRCQTNISISSASANFT